MQTSLASLIFAASHSCEAPSLTHITQLWALSHNAVVMLNQALIVLVQLDLAEDSVTQRTYRVTQKNTNLVYPT